MEDDGATGDGGEERGKVGDVAVEDLGRRWKGGEIAGASGEDPDGVTLSEKRVTEPSSEVTGCSGDQYLVHFLTH